MGIELRPEALVPRLVQDFPATTTVGIDGHRVTRYIDIESVEFVIGTGPISEFAGGIADFFGDRSTGFERKLRAAKRAAVQKLKFMALQRGADAVRMVAGSVATVERQPSDAALQNAEVGGPWPSRLGMGYLDRERR